MTTFYSQKSHVLPVFAIALLFVMFNLLQPVKMYAQNKTSETPQVYTAPGITATVTTEAEPNDNASDVSGKLIENDPPPNPNFVLPAPANDNCNSALLAPQVLTPGGPYKCSAGAAQMGNATLEAGENVSCFTPAPIGTLWYSFIADQATMWIAVKPSGSPATLCGTPLGTTPSSFGIGVYQSAACLPTSPVGCLNYYSANTSIANWSQISKLSLSGLTVGANYMVQVAWYGACAGNAWKPFCIKIGHPNLCTTCANVCGPMCILAGSSCCTVAQINQVTSTCPSYYLSPPMNNFDTQTNCFSFIAANDSMWLQQITQSYCNPNTYTFTYNLYTSGCALIPPGNVSVFTNSLITNLVVGQTYKICYTISSACTFDSLFWPFAYTTSSTLPVEYTSFGGNPVKDGNKLYWATASEKNCKEFVIERTINGGEFDEIGRVTGGGNSTVVHKYNTVDQNPHVGNNYYRLKQIDFNGDFAYSKLINIKFSEGAQSMSIVPNPVLDQAAVKFYSEGNYQALIKVSNMQGKTVLSKKFFTEEGLNEINLDMNDFSKGVYSVQLIVDDQNMISKMVKE